MKASLRPAARLAAVALALLAGAAGPAPAAPPDETSARTEEPAADAGPPSWWTPGRATYVGVPVGSVLVIAAGLIVILRRELARRTSDLRNQLARELELEAAYKDLIENAHDVVFTLDRRGEITSFNRAGERITGFARGEVIGRPLSELYDPAADHAKLSRGSNGARTFEMAVRYRDGRSAVWEVTGPAGPAERGPGRHRVHRPRRDRAEAGPRGTPPPLPDPGPAVRKLPARLRRVGRPAPGPPVVQAGRAHLRLDGRRGGRQDAGGVGTRLRGRRVAGPDRHRRADGRGRVQHLRNRNRTKDGRVLHVEWYHSTLVDSSGRVTCIISLGHDVTDQIRQEEQRRKLEEQLRQAQKMEAVGRLAGGVAHDFNNLLTVINGYSELLAGAVRAGRPGPRAGRPRSTRPGSGPPALTRQLLAFSRKQVLAPTVLDLNAVVARRRSRCSAG